MYFVLFPPDEIDLLVFLSVFILIVEEGIFLRKEPE